MKTTHKPTILAALSMTITLLLVAMGATDGRTLVGILDLLIALALQGIVVVIIGAALLTRAIKRGRTDD